MDQIDCYQNVKTKLIVSTKYSDQNGIFEIFFLSTTNNLLLKIFFQICYVCELSFNNTKATLNFIWSRILSQ